MNNTASGSLGPVSVTLSGFHIHSGVTDDTFTGFNQPFFSPPLPHSDYVEFQGSPSIFHYTLTFSAPVHNPILDLASLGSTLTFSGITLTKLSGQDTFTVIGSTVFGVGNQSPIPPPNNDSNGTVQLDGSFSTVSFTAVTSDPVDGIGLQVGTDITATPEPGTLTLLGTGLVGLLGLVWSHKRLRQIAAAA